MDKRGVTRFRVEETDTQVPRSAREAADGSWEVWITRRQAAVFMWIGRRIVEEHDAPTYAEAGAAGGFVNKSSARAAVLKLADRGLLVVNIRRVRGIALSPQGRQVYDEWNAKAEKIRRWRQQAKAKRKAAKR